MNTVAATRPHSRVPSATIGDTLRVLVDVVIPTVARGVIIRRPGAVALAERLDLDRRAIRRMQRLRARYGAGPLRLRTPGRRYALILAPGHVHRILDGSPEPFAATTLEKRAALAHFEPAGVLISDGPDRADRRRFNEAVLETDRPIHHLGERFAQVADEEMSSLLQEGRCLGQLTWDGFVVAWFRMVRRIVLGDAARDDHVLTNLLAELRGDANWAFFRPKRTGLRRRFLDRLSTHLAHAEPGSLAGQMAQVPGSARTAPEQQPPQWLFAFDAAAIATFRALAVLATHPEQAAEARRERTQHAAAGREPLPYLRACILESVRLWPTTPLVLRETTRPTDWETGVMPARTVTLIFAPFFHRDDQRLACADRFSPALWHGDTPTTVWPFIPFSSGPVVCPGRNLVLLVASVALARLLSVDHLRLLTPHRLDPRRPLPATLNHVGLRFAFG